MPSVRMGSRGQITIPGAVRREMGLHEGDRFILRLRSGELVFRPLGRSLLDLRGSVSVEGPQDFAAIREQVRRERAQGSGRTADAPTVDE